MQPMGYMGLASAGPRVPIHVCRMDLRSIRIWRTKLSQIKDCRGCSDLTTYSGHPIFQDKDLQRRQMRFRVMSHKDIAPSR